MLLKVQGGAGRRQMLVYGSDRELFAICTCRFRLKFLFLFPLVSAKLMAITLTLSYMELADFFWFGPRLFSRNEDSVRNKITRYK